VRHADHENLAWLFPNKSLVFAPDGIETFEDAWKRHVEPQGFPVAHIDDIVASKEAANRRKDKESLPRLLSFRAWLKKEGKL